MIDMAQRIPPHSEEAERGFLGSILVSSGDDASRVLYVASERHMDADSLYLRGHAALFDTIRSMDAASEHIDVLTVTNRLKAKGILDAIGGHSYLIDLMDSCPTPAHAEYYADIIAEKAKLRRVIDAGRGMIESAFDAESGGAGMVVSEGVETLMGINSTQGKVSHATVQQSVEDRWQAASEGHPTGLPMPWRRFGQIIGGPQRKLVTLLAAAKGTGKSTTVGQWNHYLAHDCEMPGAVAPFEDGPETYFARMAAYHGRFSAFRMSQGDSSERPNQKISPSELSYAKDKLREVMKLPIHFVPSRCTFADFASWAVRAKARHGIQYIFADAFKDFLTAGKQNEDDIQLSASLTALADRLDIPIIVTAHIRKPEGPPRRILLNDIRGSSRIGDDAKLVIAIQAVNDQYAFDAVANNHGPTGRVEMYRKTGPERFEEITTGGTQ